MSRLFAKLLILAALLGAGPAYAGQFENLDRLDSIVAMTVGANIGEPGGAIAPVDRRLKLAACPEVPEVSGPVFDAAMIECKAIGWRIRVPLKPGGAYTAGTASVQPADLNRNAPAATKQIVVKRGDPVQLVAGGASFSVSRMMIADEDGAVGDMIRVRENRRENPILARVTEMGIVRVPGFKGF